MLSNKEIQKNISESIYRELKRRKWSVYKLHKESKVPKSSLYFMLENKNEWSLDYLMRISSILGLSLETIIFQSENYINKELVKKCEEQKEELMLLKDKVATYEAVINFDKIKSLKE
jgi:hypothetical protein